MPETQIAIALLAASVAALLGSYAWLAASRRYKWTTVRSLCIVLCCALVLPLYGMAGFVTSDHVIEVGMGLTLGFGLKSSLEVFIAVIYIGSLVGAI